jgi:hypothetical protein
MLTTGGKQPGKLAIVVGLGALLIAMGSSGSAQGEQKTSGSRKAVTVHIDGFKKSESGAT